MSLESLLNTLSDGKFHSGDNLGRNLGVSRTAIWKQLKKIEALGIPLTSITGKGYCIEGGLDLLNKEVIHANMTAQASQLVSTLDVIGVVDSTNTLAMKKAMKGSSGYVCTAERQTAGRGRRGRNWSSPYGGNIYLSVVWEFAAGAASLDGLSLLVGVVVVDALVKAGLEDVQLKWPNDVLHQRRKLAGILLEVTGDVAGPCQVVIGIGLNVNMPDFASKKIDQPWTDVNSILDDSISRSQLLALLLNELMPKLKEFERTGFAPFRDRWQELDAFSEKEVKLIFGHESIVGREIGVDNKGAILIQTKKGVESFSGGEVSLRNV